MVSDAIVDEVCRSLLVETREWNPTMMPMGYVTYTHLSGLELSVTNSGAAIQHTALSTAQTSKVKEVLNQLKQEAANEEYRKQTKVIDKFMNRNNPEWDR